MATIQVQVCDGCGRNTKLAPAKLTIPNTLWVGEWCNRCIKQLEKYMSDMGAEKQHAVGTKIGAPRRSLTEQLLDIRI